MLTLLNLSHYITYEALASNLSTAFLGGSRDIQNIHQAKKSKQRKQRKYMSENTMPPLDLDLNSVDTSFPLIMNGELVGISIEKVENVLTAKQSKMLKLTLKTTTPTKSIKNETLNPGLTLFHNVNLEPTGAANWEMVVKNIASVTQATGWQGNLQAFLNGGFMTLQGARCNAKVSFVPEGPDKKGIHRNAKNEIAAFLKP